MSKSYAPPKAVFFDAGNTLFRPFPSVGHVYARVAAKYGARVSPAWLESRFKEEWKKRNGLAHLKNKSESGEKAWWYNLVRAVFGAKIARLKFGAFFDELYDLFGQPDTWRLFPDAIETLKALRNQGVRVGIVSNWDSRLFRLCDGLGVSEHVEFILASAVVGYVKPDRGIFRQAVTLARVAPQEALHVGDSFREDYLGARRAGLNSVLVCRRSAPPGNAATVPSLSALLPLFSHRSESRHAAVRKLLRGGPSEN